MTTSLASFIPSAVEAEGALASIGIYAMLAISINMVCGMTGMLQLGHAGFVAAGAYAAGLASIYFTFPQLGVLNFFVSLSAAALCGVALSLLLGIPCLRLRGDYLAIATLGFGEMVRLALSNVSLPGGRMYPGETIGGPTGIAFIEYPGDLWPDFPNYSAAFSKCWVIWLFVLGTWLLMLNIKRSSFGRAMMCIREDEIAAQSVGMQAAKFKMLAFAISAAVAALAGALCFHRDLQVAPSNFSLLLSIEVLLMAVLGGLGSMTGSLFGAVFLGLTPFVLLHFQLGEYRQLIYAALLIFIVRLLPDGLFGANECPAWLRRLRFKRLKGSLTR